MSAPIADREKIVQLNNSIAQHANRKELDEAMALYKQAVSDGIANSHTYAAAINANIRCGRLDGAEAVMVAMQKKGRKRDVIICTTMIKGYCMAGRLTDALNLLKDMTEKKPIVSPNIRTINTLLRGCVQAGDVTSAETLVAQSQKDFKIQLDVSSWEYLTALLAQGLKLDKVLPIVGRLKDDPNYASGIANMHVNTARAAAVLGEWKACKKSLNAAQAVLDAAKDSADVPVESKAAAPAQGKNTGGKRAWKSEDVDARRAESLELYQQHSKEELKAEIKIIEEFADRMKSSSTDSFQYLFPYYFRFFPFPELLESTGEAVSKKELVKPLMRAIEVSFGLDVFSRKMCGKSCDELSGYSLSNAPEVVAPKVLTKAQKLKLKAKQAENAGKDPAEVAAAAEQAKPVVTAEPVVKEKPVLSPIEQQITSFRAHTAKAFDSAGKFAFSKVFSHSSASSAPSVATVKRSLKVEVCSGAGEWAVTQAKQDKESDWVTLELRHDRAYQTLTKAVFADVHNMCVISGDAMKILPVHFPSNAAANLYVNHPEPPQQTGGMGDSQGRHLLEEAFFVEACRILEPEGVFTIVTDNLWYGRLLMRLVANISYAAYADSAGTGAADYCLQTVVPSAAKKVGAHVCDWTVQDSEGEVALYVGKPGPAAGHVTDASSYFDRLWKRSSLVERYFLVLRKVRTSSVAAYAGHGGAAGKKRPAAALSTSTLNIGGVEGKNTRIKFD